MRLISCHIENFGKLHDYDISFTDGLNVFCRENGWGKSTLAAFIKAMLYGLDGGKKRDLDGNERRKFSPWQGGIFGGRMEFEAGGRRYTVTRTFGETPTRDTFELRDGKTNLISDDYSDRLGEELFKLNSASFYRSIFIGQSDCQTSSTDDIHAKIGNLADNAGDMNSYESADERLKKQINALSPKLRTGLLYRLSEETADLRRKVVEGSGLSDCIGECESGIAEAEKRKRDVTEKKSALLAEQKKAIRQRELLSQRREWERLTKRRNDAESALKAAREYFPGDIPDGETIRKHLHTAVEMKSAESLMNSYRLSQHDQGRLAELDGIFGEGTPSADETDGYLDDTEIIRRVTGKYDRLRLTDEESETLRQMNDAFADDTVSPSELSVMWNECLGIRRALGSKRATCEALRSTVMKSRSAAKRRAFLMIALGFAVIATGIAFFIYYSVVWFLCAAVAGLLLLAVGIFRAALIIGNFVRRVPDELRQLQKDVERDEDHIEEVECLLIDFLASHGRELTTDDEVPAVLQQLCEERRTLGMLRSKQEIAQNYMKEHDISPLQERVRHFLEKYGVHPDDDRLSYQLHELREAAVEYASISERRRHFLDAKNNYTERRQSIKDFLLTYGFDVNGNLQDTLEQMRDHLSEFGRLSLEYSESADELKVFEQGRHIAELEAIDGESALSVDALSDEIRGCDDTLGEISDTLNSLRQKREELNHQYAQWETDSCALTEKTRQQAAARQKYDALIKARELLRKAKENMTARYVAPVYNAFGRYYSLLSGLSADSYRIDADINVTVDELGHQREIKALSAGFRDMAGICLRLGLADAMYRDEKPMLIMDDPFTNLDDDKVSASDSLLRDVSERYQVIYFTCSRARAARGIDA